MADERAGQDIQGENPSTEGQIQTSGRKENAAEPLNSAPDNAGADRYPDADEQSRSFEPKTRNETAPASPQEGFLGERGAEPAEGKR